MYPNISLWESFIFKQLTFLWRSISLKVFHLTWSSKTALYLGVAKPLLGSYWAWWASASSLMPRKHNFTAMAKPEFKIRAVPFLHLVKPFSFFFFLFLYFFLILKTFPSYFHVKRYFQYFTRKYWMSLLALGHKCHKTDLKTGINPT